MVSDSARLNVHASSADIITRVGRSPATWVFVAAWLGSALILVVVGHGFPFLSLLVESVFLLLSVVTVALTKPAPAARVVAAERSRLRLQLGLILLFIVLTGWGGLVFHKVVVPGSGEINGDGVP